MVDGKNVVGPDIAGRSCGRSMYADGHNTPAQNFSEDIQPSLLAGGHPGRKMVHAQRASILLQRASKILNILDPSHLESSKSSEPQPPKISDLSAAGQAMPPNPTRCTAPARQGQQRGPESAPRNSRARFGDAHKRLIYRPEKL